MGYRLSKNVPTPDHQLPLPKSMPYVLCTLHLLIHLAEAAHDAAANEVERQRHNKQR